MGYYDKHNIKKEGKEMVINWFPGHMKKTLEEMQKNIKLCDCLIYVLDARLPKSSLNPQIDKIVGHKPILYVLNKADLADDTKTKSFIKQFEAEGKHVISLVSSGANAKSKLLSAIENLLAEKIAKNAQKQINALYKVMVIGVPNTGKSSIINAMSTKTKAITGNKAGVTKSTQWVRCGSNIALLDTPGTLWPKFEDHMVSLKLAFSGAIKDDVLDIEELGLELIKFLISHEPDKVEARYGDWNKEDELIEIYNGFCKKRGYILRGGEIDYLRAGKGFLDDFRSGRVGKITLD